MDLKSLLAKGALIVDVREDFEFLEGHADNSINIPLGQIPFKVNQLKQEQKPIIVCCRSGARAESALSSLQRAGIEAYNAGSWTNVQEMLVA